MLNKDVARKIYFFCVLLGLLLGILMYFIQPSRWEATAIVKLVQIHQPLIPLSKYNQPGVELFSIESIPNAVERIMSHSFRFAAIGRVKLKDAATLLDEDKCNCLNIRPLKNDEGLVFKVVGSNPELVKESVSAVYDELRYQHHQMLSNFITPFRNNSLTNESEIEDISKTMALISENVKSKTGNDDASFIKQILIMELKRELVAQKSMLAENKLFISNFENMEPQLLEPISVKENRIFPSLWRICILGMLLGLFISLLWVWWKR